MIFHVIKKDNWKFVCLCNRDLCLSAQNDAISQTYEGNISTELEISTFPFWTYGPERERRKVPKNGLHHCAIRPPARSVIEKLIVLQPHSLPVMWSETVGLRTRRIWDQKIGLGLGLGLAGLVLCCETGSCYVRRHNDHEVTATFQVLFGVV